VQRDAVGAVPEGELPFVRLVVAGLCLVEILRGQRVRLAPTASRATLYTTPAVPLGLSCRENLRRNHDQSEPILPTNSPRAHVGERASARRLVLDD